MLLALVRLCCFNWIDNASSGEHHLGTKNYIWIIRVTMTLKKNILRFIENWIANTDIFDEVIKVKSKLSDIRDSDKA